MSAGMGVRADIFHLEAPDDEDLSGLVASSLVAIDGTASADGLAVFETLLRGGTFKLIAQEPEHGRAILRRQDKSYGILANIGATVRSALAGTMDEPSTPAERAP